MKKMNTLFMCAFISVTAFAAEVYTYNTPADWEKKAVIKVLPDGVLEFAGKQDITTAKSFKVDPGKKITLSFEIRAREDSIDTMVYAGFQQQDSDKIILEPIYVRQEVGSLTTLTEDAKAGATKLKIRKPRRWIKPIYRGYYIVFDAKKDLSDLPNTSGIALAAEKDLPGGIVEITLKKPLPKDYPAGSQVRFHIGGPYMYSALDAKKLSSEWIKVSCTITGTDPAAMDFKKWWIGTKYAKPLFLLNYRDFAKQKAVQIRNIKITVED